MSDAALNAVRLVNVEHIRGTSEIPAWLLVNVPYPISLEQLTPGLTNAQIGGLIRPAYNQANDASLPRLLDQLEARQSISVTQSSNLLGRLIGDALTAGAMRLSVLLQHHQTECTAVDMGAARAILADTTEELRATGYLTEAGGQQGAGQPQDQPPL